MGVRVISSIRHQLINSSEKILFVILNCTLHVEHCTVAQRRMLMEIEIARTRFSCADLRESS